MRKEKFFENILNSIFEGVIIVDSQARITFMNRQASVILRLSPDKALGRHVTEVISNTRLHIVVSTGRPEFDRMQDINGTVIVTTRIPLKNEKGKVTGAVAVFRDVTSVLKMAEEVTNLREMEAMLSAIIDSTNDAISVADADGKIVLVNKAYTRITGLAPKDVIGKPATVDIAEGESMHIKVAKIRKPIYGARLKVGPMKREVIVNVTPLFVGNEFRGSVAVIHDVSEIIKLTRELEEAKRLIRQMSARYTFDDIIAVSEGMRIALEQAKKVALTPATVLLRGESGTGKELFAHAIHNASSRRNKPFISVNCAAIPETILESELFGYEEGAFTGARRGGKRGLIEEAHGGTLFLDEVGKMPMSLQSKMLRFLETKEFTRVGGNEPVKVDVRIIAATNIDLEEMVYEGKFLPDLYYRLNVFPIFIPPLRKRREDIPHLVNHIIRKLNQEYGRNVEGIDDRALSILIEYDWPGNVRELENVLGRAMINMDPEERIILKEHLPPLKVMHQELEVEIPQIKGTLKEMTDEFERKVILETLARNNWNKTKTARDLGLSIRALYYKLEKLKIREGTR